MKRKQNGRAVETREVGQRDANPSEAGQHTATVPSTPIESLEGRWLMTDMCSDHFLESASSAQIPDNRCIVDQV
jgi:hypothetical protein